MNPLRAPVAVSLWITRGKLQGGVLAGLGMLLAAALTTMAQNPEGSVNETKQRPAQGQPAAPQGEKVATLAGGCFWCLEAVYERMEGVNDVISGYTGDESKPHPTYEQVCAHLTHHAEAVQIYYDPSKTSYEELLEVFFHIHDPTTLNRQGNDVGPQYRSAIFYHDDQQRQAAEEAIARIGEEFPQPIVTQVQKLGTFYPAEAYHQDYFRRNPYAGYCQAVVRTKVRKFQNVFEDKVRKSGVGSRRPAGGDSR